MGMRRLWIDRNGATEFGNGRIEIVGVAVGAAKEYMQRALIPVIRDHVLEHHLGLVFLMQIEKANCQRVCGFDIAMKLQRTFVGMRCLAIVFFLCPGSALNLPSLGLG